jgi:hypothetical protein
VVYLLPRLWAGGPAFDGTWKPGDFDEVK